jgi:hypothetical protein
MADSARDVMERAMLENDTAVFSLLTKGERLYVVDAQLAALTAGGWCVVPRDFDTGNIPMIEALTCVSYPYGDAAGRQHVQVARQKWHRLLAMLDAALGTKETDR